MNSTNFGSILIFASCVVGTCNILYGGEFLLGGVLFFVHYNGKCWYFVRQVGNFELDQTSHLLYKFLTGCVALHYRSGFGGVGTNRALKGEDPDERKNACASTRQLTCCVSHPFWLRPLGQTDSASVSHLFTFFLFYEFSSSESV